MNPRARGCRTNGFRDRRFQPLSHLSARLWIVPYCCALLGVLTVSFLGDLRYYPAIAWLDPRLRRASIRQLCLETTLVVA